MTRMMYPMAVRWESTSRCNLHCLHCYVEAGEKQDSLNELTTDEIFRTLDQLRDLGIIIFEIEGGEPLLRRDVLKILDYAADRIPMVTLETNGTLITKELASKLQKTKVNDVVISLDSHSSEFHDSFRGRIGAFDRTLNSIRFLRRACVPASVRTVITKGNWNKVEDISVLILKLGIKRWFITSFFPGGRGLRNLHISLTPREAKQVVEKCLELQTQLGKDLSISLDETFIRFGENSPDSIKKMLSLTRFCPAGQMICEITAKGNVIPCPYLREFVFGNIRTNSFKEIWDSRSFALLKGRDRIVFCRSCKYYRSSCIGGCRAAAYHKHGNIKGPDTLNCYILFEKIERTA